MELKNEEYYSQRISEYLDGELGSVETGELFNEISNNPALQEELKEQINLRSLFQQELLPPPKHSRFFLLGKLNLQRSAAIIGLIATFFTEIKKVIFNPAFGAAVFGVALFIFGYFFTQNAKENSTIQNNSIKNNQQKELISENNSLPKSEDYQVNKNQNIDNIKNQSIKTNPILLNTKSNSKTKISKPLSTPNQSIVEQNKINSGVNSYYNSELVNPVVLENTSQNNQQEFRSIPLTNFEKNFFVLNLINNYSKKTDVNYFDFSFLDKMSLSIIKSANYSNIKTNLEPLTNPLLNNYSLALTYNIDKNNSFSIEYGQENYPQKFSGYINGMAADINQVYIAQWYGLAYQYTIHSSNERLLLNPFFKVLGSATKIGPLFKSSIGLSYHINDKLLLTAGVEGSLLLYQFQNQSYNTKKYGFFYGARINF